MTPTFTKDTPSIEPYKLGTGNSLQFLINQNINHDKLKEFAKSKEQTIAIHLDVAIEE